MKPLHQLNIEEFRVRYNFTIDQVSEMLQLPASKYESVAHKMLVHYSYHPEIKEFFMEGAMQDIRIKWGVLTKEVENLDEGSIECIYQLVDSYICTKKQKTRKALI